MVLKFFVELLLKLGPDLAFERFEVAFDPIDGPCDVLLDVGDFH